MFGLRFDLRRWASKARLLDLEKRKNFKIIRPTNPEDVLAFTELCHDLIIDRPDFTVEDRREVYERWISSGRPCLLARHNGSGTILACSIVLPLTEQSYNEFWAEGALNTIDITPSHMVREGSGMPQRQYLLVDLAARNRSAINRIIPKWERSSYYGLGFRTVLYHISLHMRDSSGRLPIIMCGTIGKEFIQVLRQAGFDEKRGEGKLRAPIFRLDLEQKGHLTRVQQGVLDDVATTLNGYCK